MTAMLSIHCRTGYKIVIVMVSATLSPFQKTNTSIALPHLTYGRFPYSGSPFGERGFEGEKKGYTSSYRYEMKRCA